MTELLTKYFIDRLDPLSVILLMVVVWLSRQNTQLTNEFIQATKSIAELSAIIKAVVYGGRDEKDQKTPV